jgi:RimJ/RimL family protein N-acetyltransferase
MSAVAATCARSSAGLDWVDQVDQFWAGELGVAPRVLRTDGFHVYERADANAQPRATIIGTSSATIVSLPEGRTHTFENAGLSLKQMEPSPRRYVASCASLESLEVRGPAYLAYWPPSSPRPTPHGRTESLGDNGLTSLASLRDIAPEEWEEAGIGPASRLFGLRVEEQIVAVAGYERWSGHIAQLQVFCHPGYRRRGLAAEPLKAAIGEALADHLLPQYRARDGNAASVALAKRVGFAEYGWMATVRVPLPNNDRMRERAWQETASSH